MVRIKLCWDANNAVGLPKQRISYQSSLAFHCFESHTALFVSQRNLSIPYHVIRSCKGPIQTKSRTDL